MTTEASENAISTRAQHTPGPWLIGMVTDSDGRPCSNEAFVHPSRDHLGEMEVRIKGADAQANARLIAAAPEMKTQSQFLLDRLEDFEGEIESDELVREWFGHVAPAIARLRDAIAKATNG